MKQVLAGLAGALVIAIGVFGGLKAYDKWGASVAPTTTPNP